MTHTPGTPPDELPGLDLDDDYTTPVPAKATLYHPVMATLGPAVAASLNMTKNDSFTIPEAVGKLKHCPSSLNMRTVTSKR